MVMSDLTVQMTLLQMKTENKKKFYQAQESHHAKYISFQNEGRTTTDKCGLVTCTNAVYDCERKMARCNEKVGKDP